MFHLKLTAVAQCDREEADGSGCVVTEKYSEDAESMSLADFAEKAKAHFQGRGWQFYGGTICPDCREEASGK